jgi:CRISPR-associated protein Cas2
MLLVVAYDVADDRRRVRLHTFLLGYGDPVQESVFECPVTDAEAAKLKRGVRRIVRSGTDLVRFYALCAECAARIEDGAGPAPAAEPLVHLA